MTLDTVSIIVNGQRVNLTRSQTAQGISFTSTIPGEPSVELFNPTVTWNEFCNEWWVAWTLGAQPVL